MDFQNQLAGDWSRYFSNQPPVEFDTFANHHLLCSELRGSPVRLEGSSDPYCRIWKDAEQARFKSCNNRSFAMDARIRLNHLKSRCNSPSPCCAMEEMYNYNCQKDLWDREESQEEESALDSVALLDVEDEVQDEESWLYESPKKQMFVERSGSALRWCRHVLDDPSPEMKAACRSLINRLDQRSSWHFYKGPAVLHHDVGFFTDSSVSTTHHISHSPDNKMSIAHDSTTSYRLQDITDVHIMARIQEASLRQDYISTPNRRSPESSVMFPSYFNNTVERIVTFTPGSKTEASSSSCLQPGLLSLSSSRCQSPASAAKHGCQSPKLARLHQQVTQFKLLKQASSPGRTRSPLGTSLRSLQAVRNSRSLDTDDCLSADQITYPASGASSDKKGSACWSPSLSAAPMNHSLHSVRDSSDRTRSQSLSPCRIPAAGHLSGRGRVCASPDRSTGAFQGEMCHQ
ncbi:SLAIN motif-containing protein-like [Clinocottus analis]|uniref:SLAIN motif-containing protein-like n=1 Tax=Clinocottus analis TaxID=304258 RepID=UPI0035C054B3